MMSFEGNPFGWGFEESCTLKTLAEQANATYNKPLDVKEPKDNLYNFNGQEFGESPTPRVITGVTPLDNPPYTDTK